MNKASLIISIICSLALISIMFTANQCDAQTAGEFDDPFSANSASTPSSAPVMAISNNGSDTIYHLAYYSKMTIPGTTTANGQVFYLRSTLNGALGTWSTPIPVSTGISVGIDDNPPVADVAIAAQGDNVIIVWQQQQKIFAALSETGGKDINGGDPFQSPYEISSGNLGTGGFRRLPDITFDDNGRLHLVWMQRIVENGNITIEYTTSATGQNGAWEIGALRTRTVVTHIGLRPSIAVDNDQIILACHKVAIISQTAFHRIEIHRKSISPSVVNWTLAHTFPTSTLNGTTDAYMNLAVDNSGDLHLIYTNNLSSGPNVVNQNPILVTQSDNEGMSWSSPHTQIGTGYMPDLAADGNDDLHAVWYSADSGGDAGNINHSIRPASGADAGVWGQPVQRNSAPAQRIHSNPDSPGWGSLDFLLGVPGVVSRGDDTTIFWVDDTSQIQLTKNNITDIPIVDLSGFNVLVPDGPFSNATFAVEITAVAVGGGEFNQDGNFGAVAITADVGTFTPNKGSINMTTSPMVVYGFMDISGTNQLTVESSVDTQITGKSNDFTVNNTLPALTELEFIASQQDDSDLIITEFNEDNPSSAAHIYANALAVIAFTHNDVFLNDANSSLFVLNDNIGNLNLPNNEINDPPSFIAGPDILVSINSEKHMVYKWATDISVGDRFEEPSQSLMQFNIIDVSNDIFSEAPTIDMEGTLRFTPNEIGSSIITVTVTDDGGIIDDGQDTSDPITFSITNAVDFATADWAMNESNGSSVADHSTQMNDGTASGSPIVNGQFGNAREFDGVDVITIDNGSSVITDMNDDLTLVAWIKIDPSPGTGFQHIVGKSDFSTSGTFALILRDSKPIFYVNGNEMDKFILGNLISSGEWVYLAGVYDQNADTISLYKNGILDNIPNNPRTDVTNTLNIDNSVPFTIGGDGGSGSTQTFKGAIDEVKVFSQALTEGEINELMNNVIPVNHDFKLLSGQTVDSDEDGFIDAVKLVFSPAIDESTADIKDFEIKINGTMISNLNFAGVGDSFPFNDDDNILFIMIDDGIFATDVQPKVMYTRPTDNPLLSHFGDALESTGEISVGDGAAPILKNVSDWELNINNGTLTLKLNEAVDLLSFAARGVTLQNAMTASVSYTLSGGKISSGADASEKSIVIELSSFDLNTLKAAPNLVSADSDSFITISSAFIKDLAGNSVAPIKNGDALSIGSSNFVDDNTSPVMDQWAIDLTTNPNRLFLHFTEAVNASSLDVSGITIQDGPTANSSTTLQTSIGSDIDSEIIVIALSPGDLSRLAANNGLFMNLDESFLTIDSTSIEDLAANPNAVQPIVNGQALKVSDFKSDSQGVSLLDKARDILARLETLQLTGGTGTCDNDGSDPCANAESGACNNGGLYDAYIVNAGNPTPTADPKVTTGNNAWLLMAINYYTIFSGDTDFVPMAVKLGKMLQSRQIVDTGSSRFGGIFSRSNLCTTFVTEHQAEAYSGLFFLAQMAGVSETDANSFTDSAANIKEFIGANLYNSTFNRFEVSSSDNSNTSLDAQTSTFLALPGKTISDGANEIEVASALNYVFDNDNLFRGQGEEYFDRRIFGVKFREDDPDFSSGKVQHVWIEGSGQMALALGVLDNLGSSDDIDRANRINLITNIEKVRHPSGGYPTFLGEQFDGNAVVGADEINVVPAAWSYFNKVNPILNPYNPNTVILVTQDAVFKPADGSSQVTITATLKRAGDVSNQDIIFELVAGNGQLNPAMAKTNENGRATAFYTVGNSMDIAEVRVKILGQ